ncbi:MAG: hypothetical protein LBC30_01350, partial [Puniceicoccales bacterium]|nr:hypothetical protein [Puniceicoccales bacterium]
KTFKNEVSKYAIVGIKIPKTCQCLKRRHALLLWIKAKIFQCQKQMYPWEPNSPNILIRTLPLFFFTPEIFCLKIDEQKKW